MKLPKIVFFLLATQVTPVANSQDTESEKLKTLLKARKISLAISQDVLTKDEQLGIIEKTLTLDQLALLKLQSASFKRAFAEFWAEKLGITRTLDVFNISPDKGTTINRILRGQGTQRLSTTRDYTDAQFQSFYDRENTRVDHIRLGFKRCGDSLALIYNPINLSVAALEQRITDKTWNLKPLSAEALVLLQQMIDLKNAYNPPCNSPLLQKVRPWFDVDSQSPHFRNKAGDYVTNPKVLSRCQGETLKRCHLYDSRLDALRDAAAREMTMEPAMLISEVAARDLPFKEVLTSKYSAIGSSYGFLFQHLNNSILTKPMSVFPGGQLYEDIQKIELKPYTNDYHWVMRSDKDAGILTTPTFQILTNGRRAKANRIVETFLCRKFTVPDGIVPNPDDDNPDLRKRAYCSACHRSLEPMAAFFNRWPQTSNNPRFLYQAAADIDDRGLYGGQEGSGVADFAKFITESSGFGECSVRRAFEFVNNRAMTTIESETLLPSLVKIMEASDYKIKAILHQLVTSEEFLTIREGE